MTRGGILPCKLLVLYEPRRGGGGGGGQLLPIRYTSWVLGGDWFCSFISSIPYNCKYDEI